MIQVILQFENKPEQVLGIFNQLADARLFVQAHLERDEQLNNIRTTYRILEKRKANNN